MLHVSIISETKDYITIRIPRSFMRRVSREKERLTETETLKILRAGMREYREGATKPLVSLRSLRSNGHRV